jgi:hypothetical protein
VTPLRIVGVFAVWSVALVGLVSWTDGADEAPGDGVRPCPVALADHVEDEIGWCW